MDKGLLVKVLVVFLALLFLLEPLAMGVGNWGKDDESSGDLYIGIANVNITIYNYGAFLYAQAPTQFQLTQLEGHQEVLGIEDAGGGVYRITLRDSAKTREVYGEFDELGISTVAIAQIGLPEEYEITLESGETIAVTGGYQQLVMTPIMEAGNTVSYLLTVKTNGEDTLTVIDAKSYTYDVELEIGGVVENADSSSFELSVPWEERNIGLEGIKEEYGEGNVEYVQNDYIAFIPALNMEETLMLKKDYMTYISASSASVSGNFTNSELVNADFGERALLPDSMLKISAQELPELGYNYSEIKQYEISLPESADGYSIALNSINMTSEEKFVQGDNVTLKTSATVTGNVILAIRNIELESS